MIPKRVVGIMLGMLIMALPRSLVMGQVASAPTQDSDLHMLRLGWDALPAQIHSGEVECKLLLFRSDKNAPTYTSEMWLGMQFTNQHYRVERRTWMFAEGESTPRLFDQAEVLTPKGGFYGRPKGVWDPGTREDFVDVGPLDPRAFGRTIGGGMSISNRLEFFKRTLQVERQNNEAWIIKALVPRDHPKASTSRSFEFIVDPTRSFAWKEYRTYYPTGELYDKYWVSEIRQVSDTWVPTAGGRIVYAADGTVGSEFKFTAEWENVNVFQRRTDWMATELSIPKEYIPKWAFGRVESPDGFKATAHSSSPPLSTSSNDYWKWVVIAGGLLSIVAIWFTCKLLRSRFANDFRKQLRQDGRSRYQSQFSLTKLGEKDET